MLCPLEIVGLASPCTPMLRINLAITHPTDDLLMYRTFFFTLALIFSFSASAAPPAVNDFSIDVLAENLFNPMEMDIAVDGKVFIAELMGKVKVFDPATGETRQIAELDVMYRGKEEGQPIWDKEFGLMGLALAPDFATSKWVYLTYSKPSDDLYALLHYVSRFKFDGNKLDLASEQVMLKIPARRDNNRLHEAGFSMTPSSYRVL